MNSRLKAVSEILKSKDIEAFLVLSPANISYLTQSRSRDSFLLVTSRKNFYFTDSRYLEEARATLRDFEVVAIDDRGLDAEIKRACKHLCLTHCAFEQQYISYARYKLLSKTLGRGLRLEPVSGLVEGLRSIKSVEEVEGVRQAVRITKQAFIFIKKFIIPGIKELEIAAELERFIRFHGASASSFDIIVASGPNASLPHHLTSERKLLPSEAVIIDMGVDVEGYKSDLTRVFFSGKINSLYRAAYDTVRTAQGRAIAAVKPGALTGDIDEQARSYIKERYGDHCFGHSLGHGVGLEVHEEPRISPRKNIRLRPGMIFTIEPGLYVPGKFGIRMEEMVLVTTRGREVL